METPAPLFLYSRYSKNLDRVEREGRDERVLNLENEQSVTNLNMN
jgi:hypothetical protein